MRRTSPISWPRLSLRYPIGNLYIINHINSITFILRAVSRVTTPSDWSITGLVSLDLPPTSPGHQATDLQSSSTVPASMPLDLTIPQIDGADDSEFCEICQSQFSGRNRFANKRTHLINHHFKKEINSKIKPPVNGQFTCDYTHCKFSTKKRLDMARHIASTHNQIKSLLEERFRQLMPQSGNSGQLGIEGQPLPDDSADLGLKSLPPRPLVFA